MGERGWKYAAFRERAKIIGETPVNETTLSQMQFLIGFELLKEARKLRKALKNAQ